MFSGYIGSIGTDLQFAGVLLGGCVGLTVLSAVLSNRTARTVKREELERLLEKYGTEPAIVAELEHYRELDSQNHRREPEPIRRRERRELQAALRWARAMIVAVLLWFVASVIITGVVTGVFEVDTQSSAGTAVGALLLFGLLPACLIMAVGTVRRSTPPVSMPEREPVRFQPEAPTAEHVFLDDLDSGELPHTETRFAPQYVYDMKFDDDPSSAQVGQEFEQEVAWLINLTTKFKAVVLGGAGDGGVDVQLRLGGKVVGIVECKRYKGTVPPVYVRALATVKQQHGVQLAYLVTTGRFSQNTRGEAASLGIRLIDGEKLAHMRRNAKQAVEVSRVKP